MTNSTGIRVAIRWIAGPFVAVLVLLACLLIWEAVSVAIDDSEYVWTTEGPFPWYYESRGLYVYTAMIKAVTLLTIGGLLIWSTRRRLVFAAILALLLIFVSMRPIIVWSYPTLWGG